MSEWIEYENSLLNNGLTQKRIHKLKTMYDIVKRDLSKKLVSYKRIDMENYVNKLHRNKIVKKNGNDFSGSTKSDIKKFLKQYFKWKLGNNEEYPDQVKWMRTNISKDEKPEEKSVLSVSEVQKLANSMTVRPEYRLMTLLLYDSGFRINEMFSVCKSDLTWDKYSEDDSCFWIQCHESKTVTRKVPIPLFTSDLKEFMNTTLFTEKDKKSKLFDCDYDAYRINLARRSQKVLGNKITPHVLRHSSCTYWAKELNGNLMALCQRYGWSFGSEQAKTYVRRSGAFQKLGAKVYYSNQVGKIKDENQQLKDEVSELTSRLNEVTEAIKLIQMAKK